jgi:hypothetical protein
MKMQKNGGTIEEVASMNFVITTGHPVADCIDLRAMFGADYRCEFEESYHAEKPEFRSVEAAWLTIIPCKWGHIYPHGGRMLAAYCGRRSRVDVLMGLDCVTVHVDCEVEGKRGRPGFRECTVLFDVADFDKVAELMEPKRRYRLSPERRLACAERLKAYHFQPGHNVQNAPGWPLERTGTGSDGEIPVHGSLVHADGDE